MSVPASMMGGMPAGMPPGAPPGLGAPPAALQPPSLDQQPSALLTMLAQALNDDVQQKQAAAQSAVTALAAQLAAQPNAQSAGAVSEPGPLTAGNQAPPAPDDPTGGSY